MKSVTPEQLAAMLVHVPDRQIRRDIKRLSEAMKFATMRQTQPELLAVGNRVLTAMHDELRKR